MIRINKGETKYIYVTLNDRTTYTGTFSYLFELESNDTHLLTHFISEDVSTNTSRYNKFELTEGSTFSLLGGFSASVGTYDYRIYETDYQNLSQYSASASVVETGRFVIEDTYNYNYTPSNQFQKDVYTGSTSSTFNDTYIYYQN